MIRLFLFLFLMISSDKQVDVLAIEWQTGGEFRATYYGIDDRYRGGEIMANGEPFDPYAYTVATSNEFDLGTILRVCYGDHCVLVKVTDRCGECGVRHVDLSWAAFGALADHGQGVISVTVGLATPVPGA